jgi:hypothetical protein
MWPCGTSKGCRSNEGRLAYMNVEVVLQIPWTLADNVKEFLLSALRDADAAKRLFRNALSSSTPSHQHGSGANLQLGDRRHKEGRDAPQPVPPPTGPV